MFSVSPDERTSSGRPGWSGSCHFRKLSRRDFVELTLHSGRPASPNGLINASRCSGWRYGKPRAQRATEKPGWCASSSLATTRASSSLPKFQRAATRVECAVSHLPQMAGGSASALSLSRPAQASLTLRPTGLLNRLTRPLSRGSSPAGYPTEPLVSYQINRQLSGWNLPPLVIRAFGAHCQHATSVRSGYRALGSAFPAASGLIRLVALSVRNALRRSC